jgi:CheY-like chemotaxis protein
MSAPVPKTIVLVEDNVALREAFQEVLEAADYQVLSASNGREALSMVQDYPLVVDLLFTDLNMPEIGGYELAIALRRLRPNLKVAIMSGYTQEEADRPLEIDAWLQKPIGLKDLLQTANALCYEP